MKRTLAGFSLGVLLLSWTADHVQAATGDDPYAWPSCAFGELSVTLGEQNRVYYRIGGSCSGAGWSNNVFVAQGAYDPTTNRAQEKITGGDGWIAQTAAFCPGDPWLTWVQCANGTASVKGGRTPDLVALPVPWSANVPGLPRDRLAVLRASAKPPPPPPPPKKPDLPPRNVAAREDIHGRVTVSWEIPADQTSTHRTVEWFEVNRKSAEGGQWFSVSGKLGLTQKIFHDPDPIQTQTQTLYSVCASNKAGATCSDPVLAAYLSRVGQTVESLGGSERSRITAVTPGAPSDQCVSLWLATDATYADAIRDCLRKRLPQLAPSVQVTVANLVATLTGTVPTAADKANVGDVVARAYPKVSIQNNLQLAAIPQLAPGAGAGTQFKLAPIAPSAPLRQR